MSSCFQNIGLSAYWGDDLTLWGHITWRYQSRDHLIPYRPFPIGGPLVPSLYLLIVSEIFNGKCDAMVDMTLNDLYVKVKVIHFGINQFLIW